MITKFNYADRSIKSYAIRKLTPRECFRLMGVWDSIIDVMQSTVAQVKKMFFEWSFSKHSDDSQMAIAASQQFKMAGNSIVVDVLTAIYEHIWFSDEAHHSKPLEYTLFDECNDDVVDFVDDRSRTHNIITTFSGYDSQALAAMQLAQRHPDWKWDLVAWCEIDKYACQMHDLIFPQFSGRNVGDITKVDWSQFKDKEIDLFTYSSPCQDISQAGKQMGLQQGSGTRSALLWNVVDAIEALHPKFLLQENVAALVSEKFFPDFSKWIHKLDELGYVSYWQRLNAKDYGVPQNRDRVFVISVRKDIRLHYQFPDPIPLNVKLEDLLEEEVDERYFLRDEAVDKFMTANNADPAVFISFNATPRHADAMFIKTWWHRWMQANNGWAMEPEQLRTAIEEAKSRLFPWDWQHSPEMCDEAFLSEYYTNLNKQHD